MDKSRQQIQIEVVNPELSIKASPERPMVGQEVKLEVSTNPPMGDDLVSFWWDIPGYFSGTGNKATFKPKDTKPIKAVVHAKSKDNGEEIGTKEITITSQGYQVSISEPRYLGPKPMIWKCDTQLGGACPGLVEVADTQFAVFRDIFMKATVTPNPDSPRYRWSIDPAGSCGLPGAGSEIRLNCSNTGTYTAKVELTNADGVKLGEATQTVTISISDEMIKASNNAKEAHEKLQKAKGLVNEGKLDEAINLANEAAGLDPKNTEAKTLKDKWSKDREQITRHIDNINKSIKDKKFPEAERELKGAKALHPKYVKVLEAEKTLNEAKQRYQKEVADRLNEAKRLTKEGKIDEAVSIVQEVAKIDKTTAQPVMNEVSQVAKKAGWDALSKGDYKTAIKRLEQAVALNPADTDAQNKLRGAKDYEAKMPMVEAKMKEFDRLIQEKKVVSFYQKLLEVQDILRTMAMGQSSNNPVIIKYNEEYNRLNRWYNELIQKTNAEWTRLFQDKDWVRAEALLKDVLRYEHTEANRRNYEGSLQMVRQMQMQQAQCEAKWAEGRSLYDAKRYNEALTKFKENLACAPNNPKRRNYVAQLEQSLSQQEAQRQAEAKKAKMTADRLWEQGIALYGQRKMSEALDKFKESLIHWQDPKRTDYVGTLEGKKATADRLWDECTALVNQNRLNEALAKCKESLNYWPSEKRAAVVKDIDFKLKQPHTPPTKPPTTSDTVVDSRTSKSKGYWRLVDRKSETKKGSDCYPVDVLGDEGNIIVNMKSVCGENGIVRVRAEWTTPPERLIPNENLRVDAVLIPESISGTNRGIGEGMEIKFDNAEINCGYTTAGRIKIIEGLGAGVGKAGGKKTGEAKVPEKGRFKPDNLLKLSVCLRYYHQYYTYQWTEDTSGVGSSTTTIPTNISGNTQVIFNNGKIGSVYNDPTKPTTFTINQPHVITSIQNYHWNNARGSMPGTIGLRDQSGRSYGSWQAKGSQGQGRVPNAYWTVYPNITIPAGTYTVIDSDPSIWAQNSGSNGAGHTRIEGYPVSTETNRTEGILSGTTTSNTIQIRLKNNSNQNVHLYPERSSPSPNNRITPGETRTINIPVPTDGFLRFCAGRDGRTIQCSKKGIDPSNEGYSYTVVFDESNPYNKVVIQTGLR